MLYSPAMRPLSILETVEEHWLFMKAFGREVYNRNFQIGAMGPTCAAVRRAIFRQMPQGIRHVVNVGAGTGVMERDLGLRENRKRTASLRRWDALEPDPEFADFFRRTIDDPRVKFHQAYSSSLPNIIEPESADMVIATVPKLPKEQQVEFSRQLFQFVRPGGIYLHAIFRDITKPMSKATNVPRKDIGIIPANGQWLPPRPYLLQIAKKNPSSKTYSLPSSQESAAPLQADGAYTLQA